jgi:hypothetical protein
MGHGNHVKILGVSERTLFGSRIKVGKMGTYAVLSRLVRHPGSPTIKKSVSRLWTRLRMNGVEESKSI